MKQSEVMPTLRKFPQHSLWNYQVSKWTAEQIKEFENLRDGKEKVVKRKMNRIAVNSVKIIRVSDGFVYNSISECEKLNGFHNVEMRNKIEEGIEFKRL